MTSKWSLFLLIFLVISSCKSDETLKWHYDFSQPKVQQFDISLGKDTIFKTKSGVKIHIAANSFIGTASHFALQVNEALTKADMLAYGLSTNADNNVLLESSGMIQLKPVGNVDIKINPNAPIKIEMPTRYLSDEVHLYTEGSNFGKWKEAGKLNNDSSLNSIKLGEKLFDINCKLCHSKKLDDPLTGPPLAHVQKRRPMKWLIDFTRNSQEMIAKAGINSPVNSHLDSSLVDLYSLCNWNTYKPVLMNPFPKLSDAEIISIFDFIKNESEKKNYKFAENYCFGESLFAAKQKTDTVNQSEINIDTMETWILGDENNSFNIKSFEWHNCDSPVKDCDEVELVVDYAKDRIEEVDFYIIFKKRNIIYHWYFNANIQVPKEDATIIAFGKTTNGIEFYQNDVKMSAKNKFYLDFKPKTKEEIQKALEKL